MNSPLGKEKIRNVAIIAHVDHGKTTLVDAIMKQCHLFRDNQEEMNQTQILDSNDLEREKGITILAKNISVTYKGYKINVIDTPGHADFGGEVERTLNMAEGCILLVDAQEGVMPQTKVVLKRALELKLKPIVLVNKIDKKLANVKQSIDEVHDLFLDLAVTDDQLEFPILFAIGREGKVFKALPEGDLTVPNVTQGDVTPLLDEIIEYVPESDSNPEGAFQMQVNAMEYDSHNGRYLIGKINRGVVKADMSLVLVTNDTDEAEKIKGRAKRILVREGLEWVDAKEAEAGEIVAIAGIDSTAIGGTLCDSANVEAMPALKISPASVSIKFEANTSPLVGKEGKFVTASLIQKRLDQEAENNATLEISQGDGSAYIVAGRGELQLSILIETLRREGFEFQVRKPQVILKTIDGVVMEPLELLYVEVPTEFLSAVTQELSNRQAQMIDMKTQGDHTKFEYKILTRNLFGLRNQLITEAKGNLVFSSSFLEYVPKQGESNIYRKGVIVSTDSGEARAYALNMLQDRGILFVKPGDKVYEGMVIGMNKYDDDLDANPCKERHKTSVRMNQAEVTQISLKQYQLLTLEFALAFLNEEEILEITPENLRLRKAYLSKTERDWLRRGNLSEFAKRQMGL
ncbi:GTP-binding protein [bacterium]|nr:GTP-binding protein [bacterium]